MEQFPMLVSEADAFERFCDSEVRTQSQKHIKPFHEYIAARLVLEGGFLPEEVTPRPPLVARWVSSTWRLDYDGSVATSSEREVLGGLKTKQVDVVAVKEGHGPVLAVSCKGITGALRNLTNRMEETIGECTNLHITYPALAFGYFLLVRARACSTPEATPNERNNFALDENGNPVEAIMRFGRAMSEMTGRKGIREDVSRYESIALALVRGEGNSTGEHFSAFPPAGAPLHKDLFFESLYREYDARFVVAAPSLRTTTERKVWSDRSPIFNNAEDLLSLESDLGYEFRRG